MITPGDRWVDEPLDAEPGDEAEVAVAGSDEHRSVRAFRIGAALGLVVFLLVLTGARTTLLAWAPTAGFYDAQAESFLDGRLDIDADRLGIEAFTHDGRSYMYQPPVPAILRLPVVAVTDAFAGRLGQLSMLAAALVALSATRRLLVEARRALRPAAAASRMELAFGFALGLVVAGGSVPVFLASRAWVYHESAIWGMAWTMAAFAALLRLRRSPSWGSTALVGGAALAAVGSRASVGAGACAAIGLVAVLVFFERRGQPWRARVGGPVGPAALLGTAAIPAVAHAGLNLAKFATPASPPWTQQKFSAISPARQAMLEANDGSLFGAQFAPTTLLHYLRPDGLELTRAFPFVDYQPPGGPIVGEVVFDLVDRTASIPASLTLLVLASLVGLWALARRRGRNVGTWSALAAGGLAGSLTIVPFGYVAHRYLADVMPLLVLLAVYGIHALLANRDDRQLAGDPRQRPISAVAWAAVVVLTTTAVWFNAGLATVYQRLYVPTTNPDLAAGLVHARTVVGTAPAVQRADGGLPADAAAGTVLVVGDCDALYVSDGTGADEFRADSWVPVERTEAAGHLTMRIDLGELRRGVRYPLVVAPNAGPVVAWLEIDDDARVVAGLAGVDGDPTGRPVAALGRDHLDVVLDPYVGEAVVRLAAQILVSGTFPRGADLDGLAVGTSTGIAGLEDRMPLDTAAPGQRGDDGALCRRLVDQD